MILKEVKLKPPAQPEYVTYSVEHPKGLRFAVVYRNQGVVALFGSKSWAMNFIEASKMGSSFTLRGVADD